VFFQTVPGSFRQYPVLSDSTRFFQTVPGSFRQYPVLSDSTRFFQTVTGSSDQRQFSGSLLSDLGVTSKITTENGPRDGGRSPNCGGTGQQLPTLLIRYHLQQTQKKHNTGMIKNLW